MKWSRNKNNTKRRDWKKNKKKHTENIQVKSEECGIWRYLNNIYIYWRLHMFEPTHWRPTDTLCAPRFACLFSLPAATVKCHWINANARRTPLTTTQFMCACVLTKWLCVRVFVSKQCVHACLRSFYLAWSLCMIIKPK